MILPDLLSSAQDADVSATLRASITPLSSFLQVTNGAASLSAYEPQGMRTRRGLPELPSPLMLKGGRRRGLQLAKEYASGSSDACANGTQEG